MKNDRFSGLMGNLSLILDNVLNGMIKLDFLFKSSLNFFSVKTEFKGLETKIT